MRLPAMIVAMGTLYWKYEDGPEAAGGELVDSPADVGPAVITEADGTEREVNGGEWITRAEAQRLANEGNYSLIVDD
jgi:hypothetical protein